MLGKSLKVKSNGVCDSNNSASTDVHANVSLINMVNGDDVLTFSIRLRGFCR